MKSDDFKKKFNAAGMSRPRFARLVGVSPAEVDDWISGKAFPPPIIANFITLIAGLELPAEILFEIISGKPTTSPAAQLRSLQKASRQIAQAAIAKVADLEAKLWGGLSAYAVAELEELVRSEMIPVEGRLAASYELARWQIHSGQFGPALSNLRLRNTISPLRAARKEAVLLEFAALTAIGQFEEARQVIDRGLKKQGGDGDLCIARNNLLSAMDPGDIRGRLQSLNEMYETHGLAPLYLPRGVDLCMRNLRAYARESEAHSEVKVSVLMAAFNASEHLRMSVESVLAQTHHNIEIIIVDDASGDDTFDIASTIAAVDSRVRVYKNDFNRGAYLTRNRAFELSSGDVITVHDSDDWSHPQMLEVQLAALLTPEGVRGTFSSMARATEEMIFKVRPHRRRSEYVHRSFPSLMMRREDVEALGGWDGVRANADAEFVRRARVSFGEQSLIDVLPGAALSFFSIRPDSLTEHADTSLLSLTFGVRREYNAQADYYASTLANSGVPEGAAVQLGVRTTKKNPFPSPENLLPEEMRTDRHYDLLIVSDLAHEPARLSSLIQYALLAIERGARVAAFHWPDAAEAYASDIAPTFRSLNEHERFDIVTYEEAFSAGYVLFARPEGLRHSIDGFPNVETARAGVIVGESKLAAGDFFEIDLLVRRLLAVSLEWLPTSQASLERVTALPGEHVISSHLWAPPLPRYLESLPDRPRSGRAPVIGRIGEDSLQSWPSDPATIRAAFCVNTVIDVHVWGGFTSVTDLLGERPRNWSDLSEVSFDQFVGTIDVVCLFGGYSSNGAFSSQLAEAMAAGLPLIADPSFEPLVGDAAIYVNAEEVYKTIQMLWFDANAFAQAAEKARSAIIRNAGSAAVNKRLSEILSVRRPKKLSKSAEHQA